MRPLTVRKFVAASGALLVGALGTSAGIAHADTVTCGTVITTSTTLTNDVGPCSSFGLIIGANNITLDLGGHTVFAAPNSVAAGISNIQHTGVIVQGGTVTGFATGIQLNNGSADTIQGMVFTQNVGFAAIELVGITNSLIQGNVVASNGPEAGIGLFNGSNSDTISGNVVTDNNVIGDVGDFGVRLAPGTHFNTVIGNDVERNGLDGIAVDSSDNVIVGNKVTGNGFHSFRAGSGIALSPGADRTLVQGNVVNSNAGFGIRVASSNNSILMNQAHGNANVDLADTNTAPCDSNAWHGNSADSGFPPCTLAP